MYLCMAYGTLDEMSWVRGYTFECFLAFDPPNSILLEHLILSGVYLW